MTAVRRGRHAAALVALALGLGTVLGLGTASAASASASAARDADDIIVTVPERTPTPSTGGSITNAELRWGLNAESGAGAFAGGCNFLSAGRAGDAGGSRVWQEGDGLYRSHDGSVHIEKPTADGQWADATWGARCLDPQGAAVSVSSTSSTSGNQVVMQGGTGSSDGDGVRIRWTGSFTVVFYGGMTYWSVTDPELSLDASGDGELTGLASGYGTSMDDMTKWQALDPVEITLADISGAEVAKSGGFTVTPRYLGVSSSGSGQVARSASNEAHWGSFPQSFVDFHRLTGQQGYWVTTGGVRDAAKPASPLTVSYDAAAPVTPPASAGGSAGGGAAPDNPVVRAPAVVPADALASELVALNAPQTLLPQPVGLVPEGSGTMSPLVLPLLAAAFALGLGIIAVLSMMKALPWSRRAGSPV